MRTGTGLRHHAAKAQTPANGPKQLTPARASTAIAPAAAAVAAAAVATAAAAAAPTVAAAAIAAAAVAAAAAAEAVLGAAPPAHRVLALHLGPADHGVVQAVLGVLGVSPVVVLQGG